MWTFFETQCIYTQKCIPSSASLIVIYVDDLREISAKKSYESRRHTTRRCIAALKATSVNNMHQQTPPALPPPRHLQPFHFNFDASLSWRSAEAASEIASNNGSKRTRAACWQRQPTSSGGTRSRPPVRGRQPRWSAGSSASSRSGEGTVRRPQPGRIDCPFVGLGDRPRQIYNPIILANGDGRRTTQGEFVAQQ